MAAQHDLVGDTPKALLPSCAALPPIQPNCFAVVDSSKVVGINFIVYSSKITLIMCTQILCIISDVNDPWKK